MPKGGKWTHHRLLSVGGEVSIELFQYVVDKQQGSAHTYDYGLQHIAFYVDDLRQAAKDFASAGGQLYPVFNPSYRMCTF